MISYQNNNKLENLFSEIFTYGIENNYSLNAIGDYISNSAILTSLERNDDSFLFNYTSEEIIKSVLSLKELPKLETCNLVIADYLSLIYLAIFFQFKKSWSYIFLYLPVEKAYDMFDVYHQMDISHIFTYFKKKAEEVKLLPKLLKAKGFTTKQLAVLSGININTLNGYSKSDAILFGASNRNIKLISQILSVRDEIFLEHLFISQSNGALYLEQEKYQLLKDSFLYTNTKSISESVRFYEKPTLTYDELIKLINEYDKEIHKEKLVISVKDIEFINTSRNNLFLVSDNKVKDIASSKTKDIPSIVKEYALIKTDIRPYGDKYKL